MPTKKKPVASKGAGKGKRKQCSQPPASLSPAPSSDEETNQVPSDDDSVERSRPPILSEENQTEHDSQEASKKKPKKKPSVNLSDEHEEMVEWIKDHPLLFSKGLDYKDTARKKRLWEEKAKIGQA